MLGNFSSSEFRARLPESVRIVDVGPRDGLQNEPTQISHTDKARMIHALSNSGVSSVEIGAFVSPKWIPQMANTKELIPILSRYPNVKYSVLTPNLRGFQDALSTGKGLIDEIAVFTAASDAFTQKNINCSVEESLGRFKEVIENAKSESLLVRGYISCTLGCPYQGYVSPSRVADVAQRLYQMGCSEISLGDTIGVGSPLSTVKMIEAVVNAGVPIQSLAVHFHDTYGQALANILAALECGVQVIDTSISGLGGCPYAPGASGNVATEDVVYLLNGLGIECGVDLDKLMIANNLVQEILPHRQTRSKVALALRAKSSGKNQD